MQSGFRLDGIGLEAHRRGPLFGLGVAVGVLNPKNLAVAVASAVVTAATGLPATQQIGVVAIYVVVASLGVAAPVVAAIALGDRSKSVLTGWREWLERNNGTVMAVIYLLLE